MIVVTGAAGFIGSFLAKELNQEGFSDLVLVDEFGRKDKLKNLHNIASAGIVHRDEFHVWLHAHHRRVSHVFHMGARTDTTEFDKSIFDHLNVEYSQKVWNACTEYEIPLTYASSAATYGDGALGYEDRHDIIKDLVPLNPYGESKNNFDKWALAQEDSPPAWQGLKFFNVYGPNEAHKGRMASVIMHAYHQILATGGMKLFKSHKVGIVDGHQSRDFIYVKDIAKICLFCMQSSPISGLYNAGTGEARTFLDLVRSTFRAMDRPENISFIDTPVDIRDKYQYFTEATMGKLKQQGFAQPFTSLEEGVEDYVKTHLSRT